MIDISLIICTLNRSNSLSSCLDHVGRIAMPADRWELIVVDNGSTDGTADLVEAFSSKVPFRVVLAREPSRGLGRARNAGLEVAAGRIVAFTDDDCYVSPSFLSDVIHVFENYDVGCIGGKILLYDPSDARVTIKESDDIEILPPQSFVAAGFIQGANMASLREVLEKVSGFDPNLGAGTPNGGEDVDFVSRVSASGWMVGYFPEPLVYHHHRRKPGKEERKIKSSYSRARGCYYAKTIKYGKLKILYIKNYFWLLLCHVRAGRLREAMSEFAGAMRYLLHDAFDRSSRRPG